MRIHRRGHDVEFQPFDARHATDEQWHEVHAHYVLAGGHNWPERPRPTLRTLLDRFRDKMPADSTVVMWLAREHGEIVASADYDVFHDDAEFAERRAFISITVHPERRRRGIGTAFLRLLLLLDQARQDGKDHVYGSGVRSGTPDEAWTTSLGCTPERRLIVAQRLVMAEADPTLWNPPTPTGYRIVSWGNEVPEEFLQPYARFRADWWGSISGPCTPQLIREREARARAEGGDEAVVAVVDEADGRIVGTLAAKIEAKTGQHEPAILAYPGIATTALGRHDLGLDRVLEAALLRHLGTDRPDVTEVVAGQGCCYYLPEELSAYERRVQDTAGFGYHLAEQLDVLISVEHLATALAEREGARGNPHF